MTALIGKIDPDSIDDALANGVYDGLKKALEHEPVAVLSEVETSGLQGRGGAGFPVGRKWKFVASEKRTPRYIICNADEAEPLIFKDRVLIDTNPHQLLEGMTIAGYACGASEAWIYIRGEYEYQARRLEKAIEQAEANEPARGKHPRQRLLLQNPRPSRRGRIYLRRRDGPDRVA